MSGNSVLSIDPGLVTGWATYVDSTFECGEIAGVYETNSLVELWLDLHPGAALVAERFVINQSTAKKSPNYEPLRILGAVEYCCAKRDVPMALQLPVQAKKLISDDVLKKLGWYNSTKGGHSNDAARHLAFYLLQTKVFTVSDIRQ